MYEHLLYTDEKFATVAEVEPRLYERTLTMNGVSKTYAMTGWRIGFGLCPASIVSAMNKLQSHSTSNPTSIAQKGAVEALRGPQDSVATMLAEYKRRKDFVVNRLRQIPGVKCNDPRGAFYAYPNLSVVIGKNGIANSLQLSERLLSDAHVAVVPGEAFGTDEHIRISYATSMQELERGLDRIHQFVVKNS
jgi:aspartate aminotransferase